MEDLYFLKDQLKHLKPETTYLLHRCVHGCTKEIVDSAAEIDQQLKETAVKLLSQKITDLEKEFASL